MELVREAGRIRALTRFTSIENASSGDCALVVGSMLVVMDQQAVRQMFVPMRPGAPSLH